MLEARRQLEIRLYGHDPRDDLRAARPWPATPHRFQLNITHTRPDRPALTVALVPAQHAWQIPAVLNYGGANEMPTPAENAAVLRHWQRQHGAVMLAAGYPYFEMFVPRPPRTATAALQLAYEYALYCEDWDQIVLGAEHLTDLAATRLDSDLWHFWWD